MPGRLCVHDDGAFKADIAAKFGAFRDDIGTLCAQYNIAPTLNIPIYTNNGVYTYAHFGLIPSWAKERRSMQINARCETVFEKSSFKEAYKQRRCLILVNGYYEWETDANTKQSKPHFVLSTEGDYFAFAGIYESWYDNDLKRPLLTCALLTTEPNDLIATIHDRMPVILEPHQWDMWLDDNSTYIELNRLYKPLASEKMRFYPVGDMVNSVKNDSARCIEEVTGLPPRQATLF